MRPLIFILSFFVTIFIVSCASDDTSNISNGYTNIYNLPEIPYNYSDPNFPDTFTPYVFGFDNTPTDNPITDDGVTLGRVLFYDKNLSNDNSISCASCHKQEFGFSYNTPKSIGISGEHTFRNSMGFANAGFYAAENFSWDHKAPNLEAQVLLPIADEIELGNTLEDIVEKLTDLAYYEPLFINAFGDSQITSTKISKA